MKSIKKFIPKSIKKSFKGISTISKQVIREITEGKCSVCNNEVNFKPLPYEYILKFYEHGLNYSPFLFETLNLKSYSCTNCGASDRDRLIALFFQKYIDKNQNKELNLLDFAPAEALGSFLKEKPSVLYRSADYYMESVDDKVDIRNMDLYKDNTFDVFVCSHVLEHIDEDQKAMNELFRITKKGGIGVLLVPIALGLDKSVENKEYLQSEHLRWKYFGQDDHVRMYSKIDFVNRLSEAGFKVNQYGKNFFGDANFQSYCLDEKSTLYVVEKS